MRGEGFLTTAPAFDALRKVEALEEEKKMWKDRSESMEEMLKNIEADADEKEKEHQKLLFLIGMREGELARLHRHLDHIQEIRHLEGRDMYETRPGDLARPASPYFNEIDEQAKVSVFTLLDTRLTHAWLNPFSRHGEFAHVTPSEECQPFSSRLECQDSRI